MFLNLQIKLKPKKYAEIQAWKKKTGLTWVQIVDLLLTHEIEIKSKKDKRKV
jgi:hypothetical protein